MELFKAHQQWATRPADERFQTLEELYKVTRGYADNSSAACRTCNRARCRAYQDRKRQSESQRAD